MEFDIDDKQIKCQLLHPFLSATTVNSQTRAIEQTLLPALCAHDFKQCNYRWHFTLLKYEAADVCSITWIERKTAFAPNTSLQSRQQVHIEEKFLARSEMAERSSIHKVQEGQGYQWIEAL